MEQCRLRFLGIARARALIIALYCALLRTRYYARVCVQLRAYRCARVRAKNEARAVRLGRPPRGCWFPDSVSGSGWLQPWAEPDNSYRTNLGDTSWRGISARHASRFACIINRARRSTRPTLRRDSRTTCKWSRESECYPEIARQNCRARACRRSASERSLLPHFSDGNFTSGNLLKVKLPRLK